MGKVQFSLPGCLLKKVEKFEPEALNTMRDLCTRCNVEDSLTEVLLRDLAGFLHGHRNEDEADIDRITAELRTNTAFQQEIRNCEHYYISRLIYHYLNCGMIYEVFSELADCDSDGRVFFHDFCAVLRCYVFATQKELEAIDIQGVKFANYGYKVMTASREELYWPPAGKSKFIEMAIKTARKWKAVIAKGRAVDIATSKRVDEYLTDYAAAEWMEEEKLRDRETGKIVPFQTAIYNYNLRNEVALPTNTARMIARGIFGMLNLQPEFVGTMAVCNATGLEIYKAIMHTEQKPNNEDFGRMLAGLLFWRDFNIPIVEHITTKRKQPDGTFKMISIEREKDYRLIQANALPVPKKTGLNSIDGKELFQPLSQSERITFSTDIRFLYNPQHRREIEIEGYKKLLHPDIQMLPPIPSEYFKGKDSAYYNTFLNVYILRKTKDNMEAMIEGVFHYNARRDAIKNMTGITEEDRKNRLHILSVHKPKAKDLEALFKRAMADGFIVEKPIKPIPYKNKSGFYYQWKWTERTKLEDAKAKKL